MPVRGAKQRLARAMEMTGIMRGAEVAERMSNGRAHIRVINMHGTPSALAGQFRDQVKYLRSRYEPVSEDDLAAFLNTGTWSRKKPGLILSFDDGLRSNIETALPILEQHDLVGWLFIPVAFIDTPATEQVAFAQSHQIDVDQQFPDDRIAASWEEIRAASGRHVIGCHTMTHRRLSASLTPAEVQQEIAQSKVELEQRIGKPVRSFCWVGGEEVNYSRAAAVAIASAGYEFAFMTNNAPVSATTHPLQLQRTNIEADWSLSVVRFQLSGLMDILYSGKRARVNALTAT